MTTTRHGRRNEMRPDASQVVAVAGRSQLVVGRLGRRSFFGAHCRIAGQQALGSGPNRGPLAFRSGAAMLVASPQGESSNAT